jgi:hypothetical protein
MNKFKAEFVVSTDLIGTRGLELAAERKEEREEVAEAIRVMVMDTMNDNATMINEFETFKRRHLDKLEDSDIVVADVLKLIEDELEVLRSELLDQEVEVYKRISTVSGKWVKNEIQ